MKKRIQLLSVLAVVTLVIFSCKDEMTNEPFENGSATIQGIAKVDLDFTNDTLSGIDPVSYESVTTGTRIYAVINSADLLEFPSAGVNYGTITIETTVGANGEFTLTVPANSKTVRVTFYADDFEANQIQFDESVETKVFYLPDIFFEDVRDGVIRFTEVTFFEK